MVYDPEIHDRRSNRLKGYDYSQPGYYYVTICTQDRLERFGEVKDCKMILNDAGQMVDEEWHRIPERYDHVRLDEYQIMPNHLHGILEFKSTVIGNPKSSDKGIAGTGLVPVLNDFDKSSLTSFSNAISNPERTPTRGVPTLGAIQRIPKEIASLDLPNPL